MQNNNLYDAMSAITGKPDIKDELIGIFSPILNNSQLISSFTNLSEHSPIFQSSLGLLKKAIGKDSPGEVARGCEDFYTNVFSVSEELALIIGSAFRGVEDSVIPFTDGELRSKSFFGSMLFLLMTSNEETCFQALNILGR